MGNNSKIALARFRIANLEQIIKDIQARLTKTRVGMSSECNLELKNRPGLDHRHILDLDTSCLPKGHQHSEARH
ncbi:hypothetical protein Tco_1410450 [Tanacetum coccineum]